VGQCKKLLRIDRDEVCPQLSEAGWIYILKTRNHIQDRQAEPGAGRRFSRWIRRALWIFTAICLVLFTAYLNRAFLLAEMARAWVVNDPVAKADAIVVLGGGVDTRPFAAAKLYHDGVAPVILYMNVRPTPAEKLGIGMSEAEETRRILLSNNIPGSALEPIGTNVASTYDESCAVRAWESRSGAKSIVIVTDVFHTRRARWIFEKQFRGTGVQVHPQAVATLDYTTADWWRHEEGVIGFQSEVIKYIYYRFAH
jgi:uncharacterized SAM-binding protein YcdF (DUF218 family)